MFYMDSIEMEYILSVLFDESIFSCLAKCIDQKKLIKVLDNSSYEFAEGDERCPGTVLFNRLRKELVEKYGYERSAITPEIKLSELFPDRKLRRPIFQHLVEVANIKNAENPDTSISGLFVPATIMVVIIFAVFCFSSLIIMLPLVITIWLSFILTIIVGTLLHMFFTRHAKNYDFTWKNKTFRNLVEHFLVRRITRNLSKQRLTKTEAIIYCRIILKYSLFDPPDLPDFF